MPTPSLHPSDIAVALELAAGDAAQGEPASLGYRDIAERVGMSHGEAHNAVRRLRGARLVRPDSLEVDPAALVEFVLHGVRYAFPAELGPVTRGVATGPSAPIVELSFASDMELVVWPSGSGASRGASIAPLVPSAPKLPPSNPVLYELLALVDSMRIGRARDRRLAGDVLYQLIGPAAAPTAKGQAAGPFIGRRASEDPRSQ